MESALQSDCNKYLRDNGIVYWHREKGRNHKAKARNHVIIFGIKMAYLDLTIFPGNGKAFFVELKDGSRKLDDNQANFYTYVTSKRYDCYTVINFDEFKHLMKLKLKEK